MNPVEIIGFAAGSLGISLGIPQALQIRRLGHGEKVAVVSHNVVIKGLATIAMSAPIESIFHVDVAPYSITTIKIWPSDGLMALMSLSERYSL